MPEYLAPGVFVEETSFRQKSIEGVSTSTTGFVGPTRFGPTLGEPPLLTSFADYERIYGGLDQLEFLDGAGARTHNDLAHGVRAYFQEGGRRLYVARVFEPGTDDDGIASWPGANDSPQPFTIRARYPGAVGDFLVTFSFKIGSNALTVVGGEPSLLGAGAADTVYAVPTTATSPGGGEMYWVERVFDEASGQFVTRLRQDDPGSDPPVAHALTEFDSIQVLTLTILVRGSGRFDQEAQWEDIGLHPGQPPSRDSLTEDFAAEPARRAVELYVPIVFETELENGAAIADALLQQPNLEDGTPIIDILGQPNPTVDQLSFQKQLTGGNDGNLPDAGEYEGENGDGADARKSGFNALADLEDISIVAAPGSTRDNEARGEQIMRTMIAHCENMRYRIGVLDSVNEHTPGEIRALRGRIDSTHAALYYPWVRVFDPVSENEIDLSPSGFIAGVYARTDVERGVHKAPANEVVRLAMGFEFLVNRGQQEVLNPLGINCLRFFEGRGFRVWGARTTSSDPEWKYVNVRRYFIYLERSIERGTQWAVFEPNGEALWRNVQQTVTDFLFNEWKEGRLAGTKPEEAYFVRCDRTTMSQNDMDNGRMICLVGVAPLYPAEFVIFRIGQKTLDGQG